MSSVHKPKTILLYLDRDKAISLLKTVNEKLLDPSLYLLALELDVLQEVPNEDELYRLQEENRRLRSALHDMVGDPMSDLDGVAKLVD